ncbi:MAG TPA: universal stress protein [Kofleriaceae bacterium]|nr:universal stress protein [Kofleriaceae bacterium]
MFNLLCAYDFTNHAALALDQSLALSTKVGGTSLHVLVVLDEPLRDAGLIEAIDYLNAESLQQRLATVLEERARQLPGPPPRVVVYTRIGDPAAEILRLADEVHADLIVAGTHGRTGLQRLLLGSVAEAVTRRARCPVLISRPANYPAETDDELTPEPGDGRPGPHHPEPQLFHYESPARTQSTVWPLY